MRQKSDPTAVAAEKLVRDIRRATRKQYSVEEKIRIVLDGRRGESSIAELCRRENIAESLYYVWSKEFLEAGERRRDTARAATMDEVKQLRREAQDVKEVVAEQALELRLLSDNGSSYISSDLAEWLRDRMAPVRGAPCHPQTQGKIKRWHQTLKNPILLENYYLPDDLEAQIPRFVQHYNHRRYHENLRNRTPADDYFGRGQTILLEQERIKRDTIKQRRLKHHTQAV
jgi:transposase-like protein